MSDYSARRIEESGYAPEGFAEQYDAYRPAPPEALLDVLCAYARVDRPRLVVDIGSGTGLSTRAWAMRADEVVGVEPNAPMRERAEVVTADRNVRYVDAYAHESGLADASADVVTASQAFHWMEPEPVLAEAARILRPGGVFGAYDYELPPIVDPEVDAAFWAYHGARGRLRDERGETAGALRWPKAEHLNRIRASPHFRFAREAFVHGTGDCDADSIVGLARSIGPLSRLLPEGYAGELEELVELERFARRVLGTERRPFWLGYRVVLAVT